MNFDFTADQLAEEAAFSGACTERFSETSALLERTSTGDALGILRQHLAVLADLGYLRGLAERPLLETISLDAALAASSPTTFATAEVSAGMVGRLVHRHGSDEQRRQWLPSLLTGEVIAAYAASEPETGADLFATQATAEREGGSFVLEGTKAPVTNMPVADLVVVFAVTDPRAGEKAFSLFLVPTKTPGLTLGPALRTSGLRGLPLCELSLAHCRLPAAALVGSPGQGFEFHRELTTVSRIRQASACLGLASNALSATLRYGAARRTREGALLKHQLFGFPTADMHTRIDSASLVCRRAAWLCDQGSPEALKRAACALLTAGEALSESTRMAKHLHGTAGFLEDHPVERLARDAGYFLLARGTPELLRLELAAAVLAEAGQVRPAPTLTPRRQRPRRSRMKRIPARKVAICAVAQTRWQRHCNDRFQGMVLPVVENLLGQTGLDFAEDEGIGTVISVSDDVFDARTISDNAMTDVLGAHYRCEEKVAQDGAQAVYYGLSTILSGHADLVLVVGHCKESQAKSRNQVTHLAFDPFYTRPVGLDFLAAAALQAQAYMAKSYVTDRNLAELVARARRLAMANPCQHGLDPVTVDEVLASPFLCDPLRALHAYPVTDGAIGLVLASADRARAITDTPVWITGVGNSMDGFHLGERNLAQSAALTAAASRAYTRAGIKHPARAFDLVEVSDQYAHQLPQWCEGLGLLEAGKGGAWLASGGPDLQKVNLSGGLLAGNPLILGGLVRVAEIALQLSGKAGQHQIKNARRGLAHGTMGPAGQFHCAIVLERDE